MIVTCRSVEDFIENLQASKSILENVVRVDIVRRPVDDTNPRKAVKFDVVFQACAVVRLEDGAEYLLQIGVDCGSDYLDADGDLGGTEAAKSMRGQLKTAADVRGFVVLPGMITSI